MKTYRPFLFGVITIVLALSLFWVGTAYAATGCFPDTTGHWAETLICWLKENGISSGYPDGTFKPDNNITRAEMAVLLQKAANVPPSSGEIHINSGPTGWDLYGLQSEPVSIYRSDQHTSFASPTSNTQHSFIMMPEFPSALYGRNLSATGMEYCYTASMNSYIDHVVLTYTDQTSGAVGPAAVVSAIGPVSLVADLTDRTSSGCHYYSFTPQAVDENAILSLLIQGQWGPSGANYAIMLGRVTLYFQSTENPVAPAGLE